MKILKDTVSGAIEICLVADKLCKEPLMNALRAFSARLTPRSCECGILIRQWALKCHAYEILDKWLGFLQDCAFAHVDGFHREKHE